ncbi:MAG: DegQ family serine endoprotease [Rhodospirillaceae bacterium]|nr:DegQ family serine endoprotease [Rhodospirillaceae bacterium]
MTRGNRAVAAAQAASSIGMVLWLGVALAVSAMLATQNARADVPDSFADLAERLLPAVVNISTSQTVGGREFEGPEIPQFPPGSPFEEFFRDFERRHGPNLPPRRATALGSGFLIEDNYVVTNYHVIDGADEITVILQDDTNLPAQLVGWDDKTDLALLTIESDVDLPHVVWGDSSTMRVGDWVVAIGNPFGLGGTVTAGIISAIARDINAGPYDDFIQTDASINRGNSGGPMFNTDGEVIGINTAIFSPSGGSVGIGFAIPSSLARSVIDQIREYGRTRRGWLGVRIQTVTEEIAESLDLEAPRGALVASVTPDGPAADAGIEPGDVILEFDGQAVPEMRRLPRLVADTEVDKRVLVRVWRRGEMVDVEVVLGELEQAEDDGLIAAVPTEPDAGRTLDDLGLTLESMSPELQGQFDLPEGDGVVITAVEPGSPAAEKGLVEGEVILEVGQEAVSTPRDVVDRIDDARASGRRSVLLLVDRRGDLRFVPLTIGAED